MENSTAIEAGLATEAFSGIRDAMLGDLRLNVEVLRHCRSVEDLAIAARALAADWSEHIAALCDEPRKELPRNEPWIEKFGADELLGICCPNDYDGPERITHRRPIGALKLWNAELKEGVRTPLKIDALFRAACVEARGLQHQLKGLALAASDDFRLAEDIIRQAAAERSKMGKRTDIRRGKAAA